MVFEDSRLNQTAVIISLYCIDSHHTALFLEECVFISLLPSSKSPFMSVRGEIRFSELLLWLQVVLWCRIARKLTRNREQSSNFKW